jgi:prepilin signal peptidase PulO-like enzyme (type II secretory pathway)
MVGSFLNCLIYRLETNEDFLKGRSYCPHCKQILGWQDLIPILSFLILKGKCRYCHQKISWQYPLVELAAGILFLLPLIGRDSISTSWPDLFFYWIFTCFLIIIFVYDLKHYIIPDKVIYPAIAIAFLYQLFRILNLGFVPTSSRMLDEIGISDFGFRISDFKALISPVSSAILASVFFLLIALVSRSHWLGFGDIKLAFFMGLFLGFPNILVALFLAFFLGAIIGIELVISGKKRLSSEVPFGPFLVTGTFLALFLGNQITNWYLNLL